MHDVLGDTCSSMVRYQVGGAAQWRPTTKMPGHFPLNCMRESVLFFNHSSPSTLRTISEP